MNKQDETKKKSNTYRFMAAKYRYLWIMGTEG
jgi:hypothetical protein